MVVVTDKDYALRVKNHTTVETIHGYCTYEGGYFDVKYMTKEFLADAAEKGSEQGMHSLKPGCFLRRIMKFRGLWKESRYSRNRKKRIKCFPSMRIFGLIITISCRDARWMDI